MATNYITSMLSNVTKYDMDDLFIRKALFSDAGLWGWGGQTGWDYTTASGGPVLGDNTQIDRSSPVQTVSGGINWKLVETGFYHTMAIKTDGTLWLWGVNADGILGDNTRTSRSSPVQTISAGTNWKSAQGGIFFTAAIKTDGTLWTWGRNTNGELGTNSLVHRSSPVQTVAGGTNWRQVACGGYHIGAIKTDGTLWMWGFNAHGQLGINDVVHRSSPVQTVAGGTNWKQMACGYWHTAAIKTDGTLWLWGRNDDGQIGNESVAWVSSPVQTVSGGTDWKQVARGGDHVAAIKTDGTLWCWGSGSSGQHGDNTAFRKSSPVQTISGGTNWKQVAANGNRVAAIKTDGTLWTWGRNSHGGLGTNDITSRSSPVQTVSGGTNWKLVTCGWYFTSALLED